jgi:plasmid rolling circle replication initiator protein Rep
MIYAPVAESDLLLSNDEAKILDFAENSKSHEKRLRRFACHKKRNEAFADYLLGLPSSVSTERKKFSNLRSCSSYLSFHHYTESGKIRLSGGNFCRNHLLCPMCAIRRAAKKIKAYHEKYLYLKQENPALRLHYAVLTVQNGEDLDERFRHVHKCTRKLLELRKHGQYALEGKKRFDYAKNCSLAYVIGGAYSFEVKRGSGSGLWHPHCNILMLSETDINGVLLSKEWEGITGDSHVVYVKNKSQAVAETLETGVTVKQGADYEDEKQIFVEVVKYALKFTELGFDDNYEVYQRLSGRHLCGTFGAFYGLKIEDEDEPDETDEPYLELIYRFIDGKYRKEGGNGVA